MSKIYIRSQNKKQLKEVDDLWISSVRVNNPNNYNKYDEGKVYYTIVADEEVFGKYDTEARAIEVLDEIFNLLFKSNAITTDPLREKQNKTMDVTEDSKKTNKIASTELKSYSIDVVYQLPKE